MLALVEAQADIIIAELSDKIDEGKGVAMSWTLTQNRIKRLGLRLKKAAPCRRAQLGSQPSETCRVSSTHLDYRARTVDFPVRKWSHGGYDAATRPLPGGRRIREATPESHWEILTVIGAMSLKGMIATMTIEAAADTGIFLVYLLYPVLRPAMWWG